MCYSFRSGNKYFVILKSFFDYDAFGVLLYRHFNKDRFEMILEGNSHQGNNLMRS